MAVIGPVVFLAVLLVSASGLPTLGDEKNEHSEEAESFLTSQSLNNDPIVIEDELTVARRLLERVPLIDGHNDLPYLIRKLKFNQLSSFNLTDLKTDGEFWNQSNESHTDIIRLRQGRLGAQFWVAYSSCESQDKDSTQKVFEQIDLIHRLVQKYNETFELATTAQDIEDVFSRGKIASLIGVEGGHAIGNSLAILRMFYSLGVRYMTLTHSCPTPWADNSQMDNPGQKVYHRGLTRFGKKVVQEMNRIGMMVDISHVSVATMRDVLNVTTAPVIFSHSGAFSVCNHTRNVRDEILLQLPENGGIVMVVFFNNFIACGIPAKMQDVIDHMNHIKKLIGVDYIGIGSDFNGVVRVPVGLEDVSTYPNLFAELMRQGWTEEELEKVAGKNMLRVMRRVEQVREELADTEPLEEWMKSDLLSKNQKRCIT